MAVVAYLAYKATTAAYGLTCTAYPHNPGCGGPIDPVGDLCRVIGRSIEHTLDEIRQRLERLGTDTFPQTQTQTRADTKEDEKTQRKHIALGLQRTVGEVFNSLFQFTINLNTLYNPYNITVHAYARVPDFTRLDPNHRPVEISDWSGAGLTNQRASVGNFDTIFPIAAQRAEAIHFNLEGITGNYIDFANLSSGIFAGSQAPITATELYIIKENPELCRKTYFYERGSVFPPIISIPASIEICGQAPVIYLLTSGG